MKSSLFLALTLALFLLRPCFAQDLGQDVDDLKLAELSPKSVRLSWKPLEINDCAETVYSVFRGHSEDFKPSVANRIASGITKNSYVVTETDTSKTYYYYVKAVTRPRECSNDAKEYRVVKMEVRDRDVATRMYPGDTPTCWITVRHDRITILAEHVSSGVVCDISIGDTVQVYSGDPQYLVKTGHAEEEAHVRTASPKYLYFIESEEER